MTTETRVRYGQVSIKLTHRSPSKCFKERKKRTEEKRGRARIGVAAVGDDEGKRLTNVDDNDNDNGEGDVAQRRPGLLRATGAKHVQTP